MFGMVCFVVPCWCCFLFCYVLLCFFVVFPVLANRLRCCNTKINKPSEQEKQDQIHQKKTTHWGAIWGEGVILGEGCLDLFVFNVSCLLFCVVFCAVFVVLRDIISLGGMVFLGRDVLSCSMLCLFVFCCVFVCVLRWGCIVLYYVFFFSVVSPVLANHLRLCNTKNNNKRIYNNNKQNNINKQDIGGAMFWRGVSCWKDVLI